MNLAADQKETSLIFPANHIPYSDKFWCRENLAQLAQNGKNHQIKSLPNLIIFSLRQIKSMAKTFFSIIKKSKFAFTLLIFLTEFLVCRTKQRFPSMFMIIISLEKKVKKTQIKY